MLKPFKILFDTNGKPVSTSQIKRLVLNFSDSYTHVVKKIIAKSALNKDLFRFNVATLMPPFGMTRVGAFNGLKIVNDVIQDPKGVLDVCWSQTSEKMLDLKNYIIGNTSTMTRAILELSQESQNQTIVKLAELFKTLKWISVNGSDIGPVGASKILFAVFPELALPVDNAEWKQVFRTDNYEIVLRTMINEVTEWESKMRTRFETLDSPPTTVPSIYNVMAMEARPKKKTGKSIVEKNVQFGEFMNLLKELRKGDKISAEELRDYRKNWENNPQNRKILADNLAIKLTKYRQIIK